MSVTRTLDLNNKAVLFITAEHYFDLLIFEISLKSLFNVQYMCFKIPWKVELFHFSRYTNPDRTERMVGQSNQHEDAVEPGQEDSQRPARTSEPGGAGVLSHHNWSDCQL